VTYYRGFRIDVVAQSMGKAWDASVRIRRTLSDAKPHAEQVTCRKLTATEAEHAGSVWAQRWIGTRTNGRDDERDDYLA